MGCDQICRTVVNACQVVQVHGVYERLQRRTREKISGMSSEKGVAVDVRCGSGWDDEWNSSVQSSAAAVEWGGSD